MDKNIQKNVRLVLLAGGEKSEVLQVLLDTNENIVAVILPYTSPKEDRFEKIKTICEVENIQIYRPKRSGLKEQLCSLEPGMLISAGYPYLLDKEMLSIAPVNINIHPTLLPKYRGPATAWHVIANGEKESGVTVHLIDEGVDTGPIIHQKKVQLTPFDTVYSLMRKTSQVEADTLKEAIVLMREGKFEAKQQDEQQASVFPEIRKPEDSKIDENKSIKELYNFIRACDPERFPAYFYIDGQKVAIKLFRPDKPEQENDLI